MERLEHNSKEIHTPALPCSETLIQQQTWIGSAELITSVHIVKERERERENITCEAAAATGV